MDKLTLKSKILYRKHGGIIGFTNEELNRICFICRRSLSVHSFPGFNCPEENTIRKFSFNREFSFRKERIFDK